MGLWLLIPEFLRLGLWDLLCGWGGRFGELLQPRLALQLVNESALCVSGIRQRAALSQRGFELACGLPFVAADYEIHHLLDSHTVAEAQELQVGLGLMRRHLGDFPGELLAIDPHRMPSYSKRQMRRFKDKKHSSAQKQAQSFFCLDVHTGQPLACSMATASRTVTQAAIDLMEMAARILPQSDKRPLILADAEHTSAELFDHVLEQATFDLLVPQPRREAIYSSVAEIPESQWTPHWAGYATANRPYRCDTGRHELCQLIQREGERKQDYDYKAFLATSPRDELHALTRDFPQRWQIEQFFDTFQHVGWKRAGTMNLNIRYGHMSMGMLAQAAIHRLRQRLGAPFCQYEAPQLARNLFTAIDGDIRIHHDTIVVTLYNAKDLPTLRQHYQHLPEKLLDEGINPQIPWLYNLKLDFRFR